MESLDRVVPLLEINDKVVHYGAYGGLGFLSILAFQRRSGIAVAVSMILLGILLEIAQRFAPGRTPDPLDAWLWQVILAHFGSLFWPTLRVDGFRLGRKASRA